MNAEIKNTVKNLFSTLRFEDALEATRNLRGEYIAEYGVKSWNGLVAYYKKANIQPEEILFQAAEPEVKYEESTSSTATDEKVDPKLNKKELKKALKKEFDQKINDIYESLKDEDGNFEKIMEANITLQDEYLAKYGVMLGDKNWKKSLEYYRNSCYNDNKQDSVKEIEELHETEIISMEITPKNVGDLHNTLAGIFGEDPVSTEPTNEGDSLVEESAEASSDEVKELESEERVEYMLYQNDGEKVDWYGHFVNYKGLKVGESGMMVRMNNLGVGKGKVLATASMTMEEIAMFHKCYSHIRQTTASDNRRVTLFRRAFNNLHTAMRDPKFATLSTGKAIANFVLNYENEE